VAFLIDLWLPILASAVAVFVVSSIIHMVLPWHRGDYGKLDGEDAVLEAMRNQSVRPGCYMFPCPGSMKEMGTPEMVAKYEKGPVGYMTVIPNGPPAMGKSLVQWFLYTLLIGIFVAYLGSLAVEPGTAFKGVLRITGGVAVLAHAVGYLQDSVWKGQRWGITLKFVVDGIVYGLVTGIVFALLWPGPTSA
jgi:hypothetical protein